MARMVIECMNRIFDVLIKAIADEDIGRIANVKRHIVARGDKTLVIDFVKNAKIKKILLPYFNGCIFTYKDIKYFLVAEDYSAAMQEIGFDSDVIDRVCFLVGHHHTYDNIDGIDYRILVEADFLVNIYEDKLDGDAAMAALNNIFKTDTGRQIFNMMFLMR